MPQLPELIEALLDPKAYPQPPQRVELVQTQMSFVLLADDLVYKIKKPVDLGYLDYTTLEKRRFFCQQEAELNRRLCPDVYLGVVPVVRRGGSIAIGGRGKALEYAVKMRRLPHEAMMNVLLPENGVSPEMVAGVAARLAEFHDKAQTSTAISAFGHPEAVSTNTAENFDQTEKYIGNTITAPQYQRIKAYAEGFIKARASLFNKRVSDGRIRDCHGDLHAAHVCFADGICIYDCIEFNDRFRYCDVASEVAFLAMDLDHYGRADLSGHFIRAYTVRSRDPDVKLLLNFYKCYRAYVRGKVEGFKLGDPYITDAEKKLTVEVAASYFDLAFSYTRSRPLLLITTGLVGTGKSTLAQALAKRLGAAVISSDVTRKQLANIPVTERRFEKFDGGIYSAEFTRLTYDRMFAGARDALSEGGPAILDASFIKAPERLRAGRLARETGADFFIVECALDEAGIRERLAERVKQGSVSDGRWEIYGPQQKEFEPVDEVPPANHIKIDMSLPTREAIRLVMDRLISDSPPGRPHDSPRSLR